MVLTGLAWSAAAVCAQEVVSARLTAEVVEGSAAVEVRLAYELEGAPDGSVRLEALGFGAATVETVEVEGSPGSVTLAEESGSMRAATVDAPADGRLLLRYRVPAAVEIDGPVVRVRLPVVVVDLLPATAGGPVFEASLEIPPEWSVAGSFPTGLRPVEEALTGELAVVPSVVSVHGRTDGTWRPGLATTFDVLALLILFGFGVVGWRHLRGVVREARG
jgi:hypothetical protein